jgi:hypothetical protein
VPNRVSGSRVTQGVGHDLRVADDPFTCRVAATASAAQRRVVLPVSGFVLLVVAFVVTGGWQVGVPAALVITLGTVVGYSWLQHVEDREDRDAQSHASSGFASPAAHAVRGYPKGTLALVAEGLRWMPNHPEIDATISFPLNEIERAIVTARGRLTPRATLGIVAGSSTHVFLLAARVRRTTDNADVSDLLGRASRPN